MERTVTARDQEGVPVSELICDRCECESPHLTLNTDRMPHCEKCGRAVVSSQAAAVVRAIQVAVGNGIALDQPTLDALADRVASVDRRLAGASTSGSGGEPEPTTSQPAGLTLEFPPELTERIVDRAAELVAERQVPDAADGWLRGAKRIAAYIDAKPDRVWALAACKPPRIPVHHDASALIARRSELDAWLLAGGGVRP